MLRTFLENFQRSFGYDLNVISFSFAFLCFALAAAWNTQDNSEANEKNHVHGNGRVIKSTNIFFLHHECVCVRVFFFSFMVIDSSAENGQRAREHATQSHICLSWCWASLWCGKLIHIHWNTISSTYYRFLFAFAVCVSQIYTQSLACNIDMPFYVLNMCV